MKYYAVRVGLVPGIYTSWDDAKDNVIGYPGAQYKSFPTEDAAKEYMNKGKKKEITEDCTDEEVKEMIANNNEIIAFVDGSYDKESNRYSYGLVALGLGTVYTDYCDDFEPGMIDMNNVAGEILGAETAITYCLENNVKKLKLFYDYEGIEKWATGEWKCNKSGTMEYKEIIDSVADKLNIEFFKVKAHTGLYYNELADKLAKQALFGQQQ